MISFYLETINGRCQQNTRRKIKIKIIFSDKYIGENDCIRYASVIRENIVGLLLLLSIKATRNIGSNYIHRYRFY